MERKNFAGWLIISLLPLLAFIWMALAQHPAAMARAPIAAAQVSAELARTVSYGFVEQPVDEALGGAFDSDAVVPGHTVTVVPEHTVFRRASGLAASAAVLKTS